MTPADRRIEQAGGITDARLAQLIDFRQYHAIRLGHPHANELDAALRELQQRRSVPIVRGELRTDLVWQGPEKP